MSSDVAMRAALTALALPTQLKAMRGSELPPGVDVLLAIAAGDDETCRNAAVLATRRDDEILRAAEFYIEQILLHADSDSYRVLGASSEADQKTLRSNMALLMRWLHPDSPASAKRAHLTNRVLTAWETVKTPERRAAYDRSLGASRHRLKATSHVRKPQPVRLRHGVQRVSILMRLARLLSRRSRRT